MARVGPLRPIPPFHFREQPIGTLIARVWGWFFLEVLRLPLFSVWVPSSFGFVGGLTGLAILFRKAL
ncbi:MAG: hypothetical protein IIA27_01630 [Gemmatimonadetes bacterium]|nr:hypothetical protein [Gemmatimonadota bacterium]